MADQPGIPTTVKILLAYLGLIFVLRVVELFLGGFTILNISICVGVGLLTAGMYVRHKIAYYVFYVLITIALYGGVVTVFLEAVITKGKIFENVAFLFWLALIIIPSAILYRLMDDEEVKSHYLVNHTEEDSHPEAKPN